MLEVLYSFSIKEYEQIFVSLILTNLHNKILHKETGKCKKSVQTIISELDHKLATLNCRLSNRTSRS